MKWKSRLRELNRLRRRHGRFAGRFAPPNPFPDLSVVNPPNLAPLSNRFDYTGPWKPRSGGTPIPPPPGGASRPQTMRPL